jgi:hypothetical protein
MELEGEFAGDACRQTWPGERALEDGAAGLSGLDGPKRPRRLSRALSEKAQQRIGPATG